jgi:non-canonical poly(A) RNA polymerase PAPD5/7
MTDTKGMPESSWADADFLSLEDGGDTRSADGGSAAYDSQGDVKPEEASGNSNWKTPPWMEGSNDYQRMHPSVALHNEIVSFCQLMEPMPSEIRQREELIEQVKELVKKTFVDDPVEVEAFGSFATGLLLPTSDIDLVIQSGEKEEEASTNRKGSKKKPASDDMNVSPSTATNGSKNGGSEPQQDDTDEEDWRQPKATPLQRFATALRSEWIDQLSYLEVIENTRVPLVKFTHKKTNISVDVCFNQPMGTPAAVLMKTYMDA